MSTRRLIQNVAIFGVAALVSGCLGSDDSPVGTNDPATDEEAIEYVMSSEAIELAEVDPRYYDTASGAMAAPIATERWRRELQSLDRSAEIDIEKPDGEPATASVTVRGEALGLLHLWAPGETPESEPIQVSKDFDDAATRSLFFERVRNRDARHRGWRLAAISGVEIASANATRRIDSVRIQTGSVDETITGVRELVPVEELVAVPRGSTVTITVDTGDATDSVFLHLRHLRRRAELRNNGDGTHSIEFATAFGPEDDRPTDRPGDRARPRHLLIDVLSEGTLYDDEAAYDNVAWGITYLIAGETDLGTSDQ